MNAEENLTDEKQKIKSQVHEYPETMKYYKVYQNERDQIQFVKDGFCWEAFFFIGIWALVKKLWFSAAIMIVIAVILCSMFYLILSLDAMIQVIYGCEQLKDGSHIVLHEACQSNQESYYGTWLLFSIIALFYRWVIGENANQWRENDLKKRGYKQVDRITTKSFKLAQDVYQKKQKEV